MNLQIARLFALLLALFAGLVGFTSYWAVFDAEALRENSANRRPLLEEQRIRRGAIRAADGTLLASSTGRGRGASRTYVRVYPQGPLFAHAVGYNFVRRGRTGIERSHNDDLIGRNSEFVSILDQLRGRRQEGDDLLATLDPAGQRVALAGLAGRKGAVVAIEPGSGRVRVMANVPSFDPNRVRDEFASLAGAEGSPLLGRATQAGYVVGSAFKLVVAAAALDSGRFRPNSAIDGNSGVPISGVPLSNFGGRDFGRIDLTTALTFSVNTVWAQVAEQLGPKLMFRYMDRFGFNAPPPLDYPRRQMTASGVYDPRRRRLLGPGDPVDVGRVAIGQERLRVTPLQMAMVAAAIANGGLLMKPRLWERAIDRDGRTVARLRPKKHRRAIGATAAGQLTQMMTSVVREGTGTAAALKGISVAGKTGTAERAGANQAWFVGFAPAERPKIAVAVTVERTTGQGGTVAAPIAKRVMQALVGRLRRVPRAAPTGGA